MASAREASPAGSGLVVLDDFFPNLLTGFRVAEFVHHLRTLPGLRVVSTNPDPIHYRQLAELYPDVADRVSPYGQTSLDSARAAWIVFLNNVHHWLDELERRSLPFIFTLYPGGGFHLNDPVSDEKLNAVLASPLLKSVIVTQPVALNLLRGKNCPAPIFNLPGVVVSPDLVRASEPRPPRSPELPLRICFAAFRYDKAGRNKGYPQFVDAAAIIAEKHPATRFAVAGDLTPQDYALPDILAGRIAFHGPLPTADLQRFFRQQDVIVSPSRRYAQSRKDFDGFPSGTCVEAALSGAAMLSSDELKQNRYYVDGQDILISVPDANAIVETLDPYLKQPERLAALAERGRARTIELYSEAAQLAPRMCLLRDLARAAGVSV